MEYDTQSQYDEEGGRFVHSAPLPPSPLRRQVSVPYTVECLRYRNTLQGKWYSAAHEGTLRLSLGQSNGQYFAVVTRCENNEWVPISPVFHPPLDDGPYDVFIPTSEVKKAELDEEGFNLDLLLDAIQEHNEEARSPRSPVLFSDPPQSPIPFDLPP